MLSIKHNIFPLVAAGMTMAGATAFAGPAPNLTSVEIVSVYSSQGGYEDISPYQYSTAKDHGGTIQVTVREIGYASVRNATLNGTHFGRSIDSKRLCGSASYPSEFCRAGQTIIGFDETYQINGKSGGTFSATSRSTSGGSAFDTLYIQ